MSRAPQLDETATYLRDRIVQILTWQSAAFLLVFGLSFGEHDYFALRNVTAEQQAAVIVAEQELAQALANKPEALARHRLDMAKAALERTRRQQQQLVALVRATALIIGVLLLSIIFPWLLTQTYNRLETTALRHPTVPPRALALPLSRLLSVLFIALAISMAIL